MSLQSGVITDLMPDTLYKVLMASENRVGMGNFSTDYLLVSKTSFSKFIATIIQLLEIVLQLLAKYYQESIIFLVFSLCVYTIRITLACLH